MKTKVLTNATLEDAKHRLLDLESKFSSASVGEDKQYYFNVALSVVRVYQNTFDNFDKEFAEIVHTKFYEHVLKVVCNQDMLEIDYDSMLFGEICEIEERVQKLKRMIKSL